MMLKSRTTFTHYVKGIQAAVTFLLVLCGLALAVLSCSEDLAAPDISSEVEFRSDANPGPPELLATGIQGGSGSTIGPGGDLYVTEGAAGSILRIDPETGDAATFASGLPPWLLGTGGAIDIAFIGETAYVLVTIVGWDVGGSDIVGIYRIDGPESHTVIADIGAWASDPANEPESPYFLPTGVQYSMQAFRGGFLVADGHHNRVLWVTTDGAITELVAFGNIVPTGLEVHGQTIYLAQAGPNPHLPEDGKVVSFGPKGEQVTEVASGAPLIVDVEMGRGQTLFALAQGEWNQVGEGTPAIEDDGSLVRVNADGTFTTLATGLDRPTSMEIIGNTAYIVTLDGEVWTVDGIAGPPYGKAH